MLNPPIDLVISSLDEPNARQNLDRIRALIPKDSNVVEVKNVQGFENVLLAAECLIAGSHFFLVDADAYVLDSFTWTISEEAHRHACCVYRAMNPINDLIYGHGGIKVYARSPIFSFLHTKQRESDNPLGLLDKLDFPSGARCKFLTEVANVHQFNSSPLTTWRTAFRETAKLCYLRRLNTYEYNEIDSWIQAWLTKGEGRRFGRVSMAGAAAGARFGALAGPTEILLINEYDFLADQFAKYNA